MVTGMPLRVRLALWVGAGAAALLPCGASAHYPFPSGPEEKKKADQIKDAVQAKTQASVDALTKLLEDKRSRVQAAALLGLMRLSNAPLDFKATAEAAKGLKESKFDYVAAAAEAASILFDTQTPVEQRRAQLVKLTQSQEGRDGKYSLTREPCKAGCQRRMAVEALREISDRSIVEALEALAGDYFGEMDDSFDMQSVTRTAFEVWWGIRSPGANEKERMELLADRFRKGEPFRCRWADEARRMLTAEGEKAVPLLLPLVTGGDRRAKLWAMDTLISIGPKEGADTIRDVALEDMRSEDRLVRDLAVGALCRFADPRTMPALLALLKESPNDHYRDQAAEAIGQVGGEAAISALKAVLTDPVDLVRVQAAAQLVRLGCPDGDAVLLAGLTGEWRATRIAAAKGLVHVRDRARLCQRLAEVLKHRPDEDRLPKAEQDRLGWARADLLSELSTWSAEQLLPLAPDLKSVLLESRYLEWPATILRKMGYEVRYTAGKCEIIGGPDAPQK